MKDKRRRFLLYLIALFLTLTAAILLLIRKPERVARPPRVFIGKIAIVLDDWGYSLKNMGIVSQIKTPLTIAVLPGLAYSEKISRDLHQRGFEIILHLPMEPKEKYAMEEDTIRTSMDEKRIRRIVAEDILGLAYVKGASNHMGSMATSDANTMEAVFKELKKRNLFFLDSYVTSQSKCREVASKLSLRFAKRDVFLDNDNDPGYIRQQLYKLRDEARINGYAIGIGHDRRNTLRVLKEAIPELEKEGYKFVFVSELAR